jgi:hypothetical protein
MVIVRLSAVPKLEEYGHRIEVIADPSRPDELDLAVLAGLTRPATSSSGFDEQHDGRQGALGRDDQADLGQRGAGDLDVSDPGAGQAGAAG